MAYAYYQEELSLTVSKFFHISKKVKILIVVRGDYQSHNWPEVFDKDSDLNINGQWLMKETSDRETSLQKKGATLKCYLAHQL